MRIRYVSGTLGMFFTLFSNAQVVSDTIKSVDLSEVVVTGSYRHAQEKKTTLTLELFQKDYLNRHFTGNLVQTLKNVPGRTRRSPRHHWHRHSCCTMRYRGSCSSWSGRQSAPGSISREIRSGQTTFPRPIPPGPRPDI